MIVQGRDPVGPGLYLAGSVGALQLAGRGLANLTTGEAIGDHRPAAPAAPAVAGELPPVVTALSRGQRAELRAALDLLDAHGVRLAAGDFACKGFPQGHPAATVLGALLLLLRHGWLPTDYAQQEYFVFEGWGLGARRARAIGADAAAPYMRAWDQIVDAGGIDEVRRLLDAADVADIGGQGADKRPWPPADLTGPPRATRDPCRAALDAAVGCVSRWVGSQAQR